MIRYKGNKSCNVVGTTRFALTHNEIRAIRKLSNELDSTQYDVFHMILHDALDTWLSGLKACKKV